MHKNTRFQVSALSAAIASTLTATPVVAQQPMLEEVVVTATRRAESIQDIPINITALGGDVIERERISNLADISKRVPGMTLVDQGPRQGNILTVRGLSVDSLTAPEISVGNSGGDTVGIYMGEIPIYADWRLEDMDRVEVLIGPQGTLYGAGTLGGAVRYLPNRPQADELTVQVRGDIYDLEQADDLGYETGVTINVPIIEDTLAVRAVVDYEDDPGFIDAPFLIRQAGVSNPQPDFSNPDDVRANLNGKEDVNTDETWSGRLAVRYTGDRIDSTLSYYYQQSDIGGRQISHKDAIDSDVIRTGDYESALRFEEPIDRENQLIALEIVADLGFAELTSATGYSEYEEDGNRDQTDLLLAFEYGYELFPAFSAFTRDRLEQDRFNQELRLVSTSDGPLSWIVGAFYNRLKTDQLDQEFTPNFDAFAVAELGGVQLRPDSLEYIYKQEDEQEETAIFGEIGYDITDRWQVTVGARWFKYENDTKAGSALPLLETVFSGDLPPDETGLELVGSDGDDDDVVMKFNTSYYVTDDVMTYFTYSEGYRLGAVNPAPPCKTNDLGEVQNVCALPDEERYDPDTTDNYEIGLRSTWGDNLILNAAVYYIEWDDIQLGTVTENGSQPITVNGSSAVSQGVELSGQWYITPSLWVTGSYAYTEAELDEDSPGLLFDQGDAFSGVDGKDGDQLPGTPEHQAYLALDYEYDMSDGSQLAFNWSMSYTDEVLTKVGERASGETLDSFTLHNASVTWINANWRISLYGDNIFDEYAETGLRGDTSWQYSLADINGADVPLRRYYHNIIRPRQVGLSFVYDFGG